jgi:hypothetical protein
MPRINRPSPGNDPLLDRDRYLLRQAGVTTPHDLKRENERAARNPPGLPRNRPLVSGDWGGSAAGKQLAELLAAQGHVDDASELGAPAPHDHAGVYLPLTGGTVTGNLTIGDAATDVLTVVSHLVGPATGPGIAAGAAAGTSPTVAITGNDNWGKIEVTVGTSPATGQLVTITFGTARPNVDYDVILTAREADAARHVARWHPVVAAGSNWRIDVIDAALSASTAYAWAYIVVER